MALKRLEVCAGWSGSVDEGGQIKILRLEPYHALMVAQTLKKISSVLNCFSAGKCLSLSNG